MSAGNRKNPGRPPTQPSKEKHMRNHKKLIGGVIAAVLAIIAIIVWNGSANASPGVKPAPRLERSIDYYKMREADLENQVRLLKIDREAQRREITALRRQLATYR